MNTEQSETRELAAIGGDLPLSVEQIHAQVQVIQRVMQNEMIEGVHYGTIPGCGDKSALFKAGADKLCMTFRLSPKFDTEDLGSGGEVRIRVRAKLYTIGMGLFVGEGIGEGSSLEDKYAWEKPKSQEHFDATMPDQRRLKYTADGHFQQIRANIADRSNTILKMAKKRALVDAILTVTAASDMFSQDIDEDDAAGMVRQQAEKTKPKAKTPPAPLLPYGPHKGQQITDPDVSLSHLQSIAESTARGIQDPKREKFKAYNQLFLAALDAEIAHRKQNQPKEGEKPAPEGVKPAPGDAQGAKPVESSGPAFSDSSWADFLRYCEEEVPAIYLAVKKAFKIDSAHDLLPGQRQEFFEKVNLLVSTQQ